MNSLSLQTWQSRAHFLDLIRTFFKQKSFLAVDTPVLNSFGATEPFLDPLEVREMQVKARPGTTETLSETADGHTRPYNSIDPLHRGFLITSPEWNLKQILGQVRTPIYQMAHVFRGNESGGLHTQEFLMLEFYLLDANHFDLMNFMEDLIHFLVRSMAYPENRTRDGENRLCSTPEIPLTFERLQVCELFQPISGNLSRSNLEEAVIDFGLLGHGEKVEQLRYDELFFSLFLNKIEPQLPDGPVFIYNYPAELAAYSKIVDNVAQRVELYWKGIELANGYNELTDSIEIQTRLAADQKLRQEVNKPAVVAPNFFTDSFPADYPESAGMAVGLDRLLMILLHQENLSAVSPFY